MAFPFATYVGLVTTAGANPDMTKPDRSIALSQLKEGNNASGSVTSRWSVSANTTLRLNVQPQSGAPFFETAQVKWAITARRVR